ncbi:MAG: nucleoside hydrolase [Fimbriimonas sp.]
MGVLDMPNDVIPVLLDTDIGSDIDDAVALAYLLRQPRCELLGVTTVSGDVQQRAALVKILCASAGRDDIPIHCGRRGVFAGGPGQPNVPQYVRVSHHTHRLDRPENTAVQFLQETIRSRPGEIVLLSIGPFGNIATLLALDPEIPALLRGFVSMAGKFSEPDYAEWNCRVDPVATAVAYSHCGPGHVSVGLDVTLACVLPADEIRLKFAKPGLEIVSEMAEVWFSHSEFLTFHDPLAAALIFHPELCELAQGAVEIVIGEGTDRDGITLFTPGAGKQFICRSVESSVFFEKYFAVF